jgi:2'-5' RNA ligase
MSAKFEFGCVMAVLNEDSSKKILTISKKLIPDNLLYNEEGQDYGREHESHVTVKFGLTENYSKEDMGKVISHIHPFPITLTKISIFSNEKFDVVKIDVESDTLIKLNKIFSKLPNEDEHPIYHPHLTLAYVKPEEGKQFIKDISTTTVIVNRMKYSNPVGKYYYNL